MNEDKLNELLERCESPIERELLTQLYPHLSASRARELRAQHKIDEYNGILTFPDFAFPDMRIAIYCDGFAPREGDREAFKRDRLQSRELQLLGWIVLRFAGSEINYDSDMVVKTIQRAIARRDRQRNWRDLKLQLHSGTARQWKHQTQQKTEGGLCGIIFLASVIVGVLVLLNFIF